MIDPPPFGVEIFVGKRKSPDFDYWLHVIPRVGESVQIEDNEYEVTKVIQFLPSEKDPRQSFALEVKRLK